jgi:hypothetical protein
VALHLVDGAFAYEFEGAGVVGRSQAMEWERHLDVFGEVKAYR